MRGVTGTYRGYFVIFFVAVLLFLERASAITVLEDDFNGSALDSGWTINFQDAVGWTFGEVGGMLSVSNINPAVINSVSGGTWSRVILSRSFPRLDDFNIDFAFSWDSEGSMAAMQYMVLTAGNSTNFSVVGAGYGDAWVGHRGSQWATLGGDSMFSGFDTLPITGSALVEITRIGGIVDISWDGMPLMSGTVLSPVDHIDLNFWYYAYNGAGGVSFFGNESVDLIRVQGVEASTVTEPNTTLLVIFFLGIFLFHNKKRIQSN